MNYLLNDQPVTDVHRDLQLRRLRVVANQCAQERAKRRRVVAPAVETALADTNAMVREQDQLVYTKKSRRNFSSGFLLHRCLTA